MLNSHFINASDNLRRTALHLAVMGEDEEYGTLQEHLNEDVHLDNVNLNEDVVRGGNEVDEREQARAQIGDGSGNSRRFDDNDTNSSRSFNNRSRHSLRIRIIKRLLTCGASVHCKDYLNETPLHTWFIFNILFLKYIQFKISFKY